MILFDRTLTPPIKLVLAYPTFELTNLRTRQFLSTLKTFALVAVDH